MCRKILTNNELVYDDPTLGTGDTRTPQQIKENLKRLIFDLALNNYDDINDIDPNGAKLYQSYIDGGLTHSDIESMFESEQNQE
jgi:hypothetical protein